MADRNADRNACFISYKRPYKRQTPYANRARRAPKHQWLRLAETFQALFEAHLSTPLGIYRDELLDGDPGKPYPGELSKNLCRSACLVALLIPEYLESSWCVGEWKAMESLEASRGQIGLIIPVLYRGKESDFAGLLGAERRPIDFSEVVVPAKQLKDNVLYASKIEAIANTINRWARDSAKSPANCDGFSIPLGPEENTPKIAERSPFAR
jgi:hypothetical protein